MNNTIRNTANFGVWGDATAWAPKQSYYDVRLMGNTLQNIGHAGFFVNNCNSEYIYNNDIEDTGADNNTEQYARGSTFWYVGCSNVLAEYNFLAHARGNGDSSGLHIDINNNQVLYQNNFCWDNEGGFFEIMSGCSHLCCRYNISDGDGWRVPGNGNNIGWPIAILQDNSNVYIYNNSVYSTLTTEFSFNPTNSTVLLDNNIFDLQGTVNFQKLGGKYPGYDCNANMFWNWNLYDSFQASGMPAENTYQVGDPQFNNPSDSNPCAVDFYPYSSAVTHGVAINQLTTDSTGINIVLSFEIVSGLNMATDLLTDPINNSAPDIGALVQ
jgi:hypothetical protein